jgi:pyrroline-5-carboxylate reductase
MEGTRIPESNEPQVNRHPTNGKIMSYSGIGFIGGGRVARILLSGWKKANALPGNIVVSDPNAETLAKLKTDFPTIEITGDNRKVAAQSVVFIAVHPPAMMATLADIRDSIMGCRLVVSLAPKFTLAKLAEALGGHMNVARMIPNAPSVIGAGFNPMTFSPSVSGEAKQEFRSLMTTLGECPEVAEGKLEGYALLTAMGPTYLWFQLQALREVAAGFGLTDDEVVPALSHMVSGATRTLLESHLTPAQVMDLIPVKPLADDEAAIKAAYQNRLPALFAKIKP